MGKTYRNQKGDMPKSKSSNGNHNKNKSNKKNQDKKGKFRSDDFDN
jgi:hypothetical protein